MEALVSRSTVRGARSQFGAPLESANCRYVLISPCRDEAQHMRETLDSVIAQSIRPAKWIIVDDGSTDRSPQILAEYAATHDWIHVVTRSDRGRRSVGSGVVDAFYAGYETINQIGRAHV